MTRFRWLLSLVVVSTVLAPGSLALPITTNGLVITSASVEVESVASPDTWANASTVYEGSPVRITVSVDAPETGVVQGEVSLPGLTGRIGAVTAAIPRGASTLTIPVDLSYGAWLAGSNPNIVDHLDVTLSFTRTPPAPAQTDTAPTDIPSPEKSPQPTVTVPPVPTKTPPTSTVATRQPVRLALSGASRSDRRKLRGVLRTFPPGATVLGIIRVSRSPGRDCPTRRELARSLITVAEASGRTVIVKSGAPLSRGCARVELRSTETPRVKPRALTDSISFDVPVELAPRPLILIHGMWSSKDTWNTYTQAGNRLVTVHPRWRGFAVDTMDTGSPLLPYKAVKTVTQNADLAWTYIRTKMSALNAHEVDVAAHSLGGVITRRMLHDSAYGESAQDAIRSVVLLGTPNGGSSCSEAWAVPANRELTYAAMATFNNAYPGYPGAFTTSLYSDHFSSTCFYANSGDLFVPTWSTQAQSVNVVRKIDPGIQHANMPSDERLFTDYVLPALGLPSAPAPAGPTTALSNPNGSSTRLADGSATGNPLAITRTVTISDGSTLVASVVAEDAIGTLQTSGGTPINVALTSVRDFPLFEARATYAELGGSGESPITIEVTISATTSAASPEWRWSLTTQR